MKRNMSAMKRKGMVEAILSLIVVICLIAQPMFVFAEESSPAAETGADEGSSPAAENLADEEPISAADDGTDAGLSLAADNGADKGPTATVDNSVDKSTTRVVGVLKLTGCTGSADSFESGLTVYDSDKVKVDYSNPTNDYIQSLIAKAKEKTERLGQAAVDGHSGSCTLKPAETEKSESPYDNRVYTWVPDDGSEGGILIGDPNSDGGAAGNQNRHMVVTGDYARTTTYTVTTEVVFPDHVWGEGVVTQEATETEEGIRTFTCSQCQKTKTESIPKLNDEQGEPDIPANYTVSFNMNGHGEQVTAQSVKAGEKASRPADPEASGYTFGGWYADESCSTQFDFNSAISADTTVYAKWTEDAVTPPAPINYTVSFNMNGHGTQIAAQSVESGSKATKPADPKASGYTFGGWYADESCSTQFDFNSAISADTTVYAKWTKNAVKPADPNTPKTGDNSNMLLWTALLIVSSGALAGTVYYSKMKKVNDRH